MCDCQSYNQPETTGTVPEVILDPRPLFDFATKTVCVDACIAEQIMSLWQAGIFTRGCCCGHNRDFPNVFLHDPTDAVDACRVLSKDPRQWRVMFYTRAALRALAGQEDTDNG